VQKGKLTVDETYQLAGFKKMTYNGFTMYRKDNKVESPQVDEFRKNLAQIGKLRLEASKIKTEDMMNKNWFELMTGLKATVEKYGISNKENAIYISMKKEDFDRDRYKMTINNAYECGKVPKTTNVFNGDIVVLDDVIMKNKPNHYLIRIYQKDLNLKKLTE